MMAGVRWLLVCLLVLAFHGYLAPVEAGTIRGRARRALNESMDDSGHEEAPGNETGEGREKGEGEQRYSVAKFDFAYVAGPMVVTGWILLASIAKIGEFDPSPWTLVITTLIQ